MKKKDCMKQDAILTLQEVVMQNRWLGLMLTVAVLYLMLGIQSLSAETSEDIGKGIADTQLAALQQVVALMKDRGAPKDLRPKLEQLKEENIKNMVALGKKREALSPDEQKKVGSIVEKAHKNLPPDLFIAFTEGNAYYLKTDKDLSKLIMEFFLIPQYALFEVLKQRSPKEAERLGIK
jgi:hypothetical protein